MKCQSLFSEKKIRTIFQNAICDFFTQSAKCELLGMFVSETVSSL